VILGALGATLAVTSAMERRRGAAPTTTTLDAVLLCAASFKAARALSRERVGSVLRQPFVEGNAQVGDERPAGTGLQRAVGELVTCTRCAGVWAAACLITVQTATPRFGRLVTLGLAAGAGNDFLHAGFAALCARTDSGAHSMAGFAASGSEVGR